MVQGLNGVLFSPTISHRVITKSDSSGDWLFDYRLTSDDKNPLIKNNHKLIFSKDLLSRMWLQFSLDLIGP